VQQNSDGIIAFVAGGIGITPLLAQLEDIDISRLRLFWSLHVSDIGLVYDTFQHNASLPKFCVLCLSGQIASIREEDLLKREAILNSAVSIEQRRVQANDLTSVDAEAWYLCADQR
jgi:predicted ferric reductase